MDVLIKLQILALLNVGVDLLVQLFLILGFRCLFFIWDIESSVLVSLLSEPAEFVVFGLEVSANFLAFFILDVYAERLVEKAPHPLSLIEVSLNFVWQIFTVPFEGTPAVITSQFFVVP